MTYNAFLRYFCSSNPWKSSLSSKKITSRFSQLYLSYNFNNFRLFFFFMFFQECLESRVAELEKALEAERKLVQREKLTVARLQRQLSRVSDKILVINFHLLGADDIRFAFLLILIDAAQQLSSSARMVKWRAKTVINFRFNAWMEVLFFFSRCRMNSY